MIHAGWTIDSPEKVNLHSAQLTTLFDKNQLKSDDISDTVYIWNDDSRRQVLTPQLDTIYIKYNDSGCLATTY